MSGHIGGKIGGWDMTWISPPRGPEGVARLRINGGKELLEVRWRRDETGMWIETPTGVHGFDISGSLNDEGALA